MMQLEMIDVTPAKKKQFEKKGICTVEDLVGFFPRDYIDCSVITGILLDGCISNLILHVNDVRLYKNGTPLLMAMCTDKNSGERVNVLWFHQNYLYSRICSAIGRDALVVGKAVYNAEYRNYSLSSPMIFTPYIKNNMRLHPVYSKIAGMSEEYLLDKIHQALRFEIKEPCPERVIRENNLMSMQAAINELHYPSSMSGITNARDRLIFNDLLYFAFNLEQAERKVSKGSQYGIKSLKVFTNIIDSLPFQLTQDQKRAVDSMIEDMRKGRRINALVQGDTGCGKTIVAFLMMIAAADSGYQSVLMAPTQTLAMQHYNDLSELVKPFGFKVAFLGGGPMKKAEKTALFDGIKNGEHAFVVGTHAVLNRDIEYHALALTITDEEHKFGVLQRNVLVEQASSGVHSITMSATPIPRSLAMTVYGNGIQLYTIKTMPNGRLPVKTAISSSYDGTFKFLYRQIREGRQVYVVCPMIDKNENLAEVKSVEEIYELYCNKFKPYNISVGAITGQTPKDEAADIIHKYKSGDIDILVSTTVIEVGVNVPNASVIVVQNAERFGLASLHQLRGRVGRGKYQSYCVLFSKEADNERLKTMVETVDGFGIAEADLRLRGPGEFIGTRQSGDDKYIMLMLAYPERYEKIKSIAGNMLDRGEEIHAK